jgi:hypothetical protein
MIRVTLALGMLGALLSVSICSADPTASSASARYTPQFSIAKTEFDHYWIKDRGQRIALVGSCDGGNRDYQIGLFRHFPGQALDEKQIQDSEILDFVSLPGLRLDTNWISARAMRGVPGEMKLDSSDPTQLTIRLYWKKSAEEFGTQVIRVAYDADMARYVVHVEDDLQLSQPGGGEYCNFYANGLGDFRPGVGRYDRLLYQDGDDSDKLKAHYLSVHVPKPGPGLILLPAANGLIGYADEKDGNPVVIVEESTPRTTVGICLCWFDSHLRWDEPANKTRVRRGSPDPAETPAVSGQPYRYHAKLKAYWNSPAETRTLLAKAQTVPLAPFADHFANSLPIDMNVVNDFEHTTDFLSGNVKHIYFSLKPLRPSGGISYEKTVGRSGHSSILFVSKTDKGIQQGLTGPELMVTPGRQVKISAWVKTADVTGEGFYLESGFQRWTPAGDEQLTPLYQSEKLTGTNDWTLLEIPLHVTPPQSQFLGKGRITFHLSGKGTAWVDDFIFAEQDPDGPSVCDPNAPIKP